MKRKVYFGSWFEGTVPYPVRLKERTRLGPLGNEEGQTHTGNPGLEKLGSLMGEGSVCLLELNTGGLLHAAEQGLVHTGRRFYGVRLRKDDLANLSGNSLSRGAVFRP